MEKEACIVEVLQPEDIVSLPLWAFRHNDNTHGSQTCLSLQETRSVSHGNSLAAPRFDFPESTSHGHARSVQSITARSEMAWMSKA